MAQRDVFRAGEGNEWFRRNESAITPDGDPVLKVLADLKPKRLLEVGCSNGWRLEEARKRFGALGTGLDPSQQALTDGLGKYPDLRLKRGTAESLPFDTQEFDCIVYGWCLYLCDREDLFYIAAEGDRVLAPGGYIVIYDFCTPHAYSNPYSHREGIQSYKMDYARLWSWNPRYTIWRHEVMGFHGVDPMNVDDRLAVTVLKHTG